MNEKKTYYLLYGGWVVAFLLLWYVLSRANVSNQPSGIEPAKQQLDATSNYQQSAITDVERAERYAQSGQVRLDGAARSTEELQVGADESAKVIADCQRIIRAVQERGEAAKIKN